MRQRSLQFTVPNWVKWFLVILFLFLFSLIVYGSNVYQLIQENKIEGFTESEERVLTETDMITVDEISRFHGRQYYHVITGKNEEGEQLLAYVNQSNSDKAISVFSLKRLVNKERIEESWQTACESCQLLQMNYGIRDNVPLLELSYFDNKDRLSYRYYRLDNGEYESGVTLSNDYKN
ncbi:hypothetical protein BN1058_00937 [Paraliobacillus sp. PM-2]|uniref:cell wall elongation regulator TseB-like domain-containing protein n=1 Tax=Paraliobacillus sp. PM-2 TaxID=1462524 RepID=UPI00061C7672|nr:DUF5590 domain-containing protein [Paraliobacillus sp. PM-2]CQR46665.1 hypothetical protein BN1058_00937 [Paraliobacillus sp. PM-2]